MISLFVQRPDEIKVAYHHFLEILDKGEQKFDYQFRIGKLASAMGWMMTTGYVNGKKERSSPFRSISLSLSRK